MHWPWKQCVPLWTQGRSRPDEDTLREAVPEHWYQVRTSHKKQADYQERCENHYTSALNRSTSEACQPVIIGLHHPNQHTSVSLITIKNDQFSSCVWSLEFRFGHENCNSLQQDNEGSLLFKNKILIVMPNWENTAYGMIGVPNKREMPTLKIIGDSHNL